MTVQNPETPVTDGAADVTPKRSRGMGLIASSMRIRSRSRSRSRHSAVTDHGQILDAQDPMPTNNLSNIAPQVPGLADATTLAPERSASAVSLSLDSQNHDSLQTTIIPSDNPELPSTIIPATDTLTTRPTAGGIAYPFSLKVDGPDGKDVNASTLTLASVTIPTPPAVDDLQIELHTESETVNEQVLKEERPGVERYFTAGPALESVTEGVEKEKEEEEEESYFTVGPPLEPVAEGVEKEKEEEEVEVGEKVERPHVDRFVTAQEDLTTLAAGGSKA